MFIPQNMKLILSVILLFMPGLSNHRAGEQQPVKLSTFKDVPEELMGCGDDFYLNAKDKDKSILICRTDYVIAYIRLNNKAVSLKVNDKMAHEKDEEIYTSGQFILSIKKVADKQTGIEDYDFKGTITIKSGTKIIYQQNVIGQGGC